MLLITNFPDIEVTFGLLYYLETRKMFRIRGIRHEILQMIQERNRLAGFVREKTELPPMIKQSRLCNQCYSKTPCFVYHRLLDDGDGGTSGMGDKFHEAVGHLNAQHGEFFRKWDSLLTKEEKNMMKFRRELWTMLSNERESLGRCFGQIVIEPGTAYEEKNGPKINRYQYTFVKQKTTAGFSFTESQISIGEPIVVSDERGHFALANGYVLQISPKRITVAVDRRLHDARVRGAGFDADKNQTFKGIMEIRDEGSSSSSKDEEGDNEVLYRLDKDEFSNGMATVRNNLICMMEKNLFQALQLRKLIIEGQEPRFNPSSSAYTMSASTHASLNVDQKQAIEKVMNAKDYALVLGMPGTGKTTTIAHIIRALVSQGKSVLLTSYTHTAVDNILLKIRDDNMRILRLGATAKVHPEVQQFVDLAAVPKKTIEELQESYEQSTVVATTCLGVNHPIFNERIFDYCIVDEASQITLPVCLGPIRMARTFILVGDHYQLPPLVQNKEAQEGGLDVSLFKLLSDAQPSSVVNLEHQYRMCEEIMLLSNTLIYSGRLKCGTPEVASRSLSIPNMSDGLKHHHVTSLTQMSSQRPMCLGPNQGRCWIKDLLDPSAKTRLVNTDTLSLRAPENVSGSRIFNPAEATLCAQLVNALVSSGISPRDIGVITFYRSQLSLLRQTLRRHSPSLEMHTADKFQGRDKEVVILSCVRSNSDRAVGELLRDWRRVNVAFTRARTKLLVVGSKSTLRDGNDLLHKYVDLMETNQWIYDLPRNAMEDHVFENVEESGHSPLQQRKIRTSRSSVSPSSFRRNINTTAISPEPNRKRKRDTQSHSPISPVLGDRFKREKKSRTPQKRGARVLSGDKILSKSPILNDLMNDFIG
jgi:DNA replication ATP-dependent helicase Dna2